MNDRTLQEWSPAPSLAIDQAPASVSERPTILVRPELNVVTDEAERALRRRGVVFVRSRRLVRVVREQPGGLPGLERPAGAPVIEVLNVAALRGLLDDAAEWVRCNARGQRETPSLPPVWVAETLASRGAWPFPVLEGVTEAPSLRPDGTVLDRPGYDATTGLLYEPSGRFPPVPGVADA